MSPTVEIVFGQDFEYSSDVYSLLRRIRCDDSTGSWPSGTSHVEIIRPLGGGRSGGAVLLAEMHGGSRSLCVIKIDGVRALTREWAAYREHVEPLRSALFAPIIAATPDVVDGTATSDGRAAVVYSEVSEYTGQSGDAVRTIGELVALAVADPATLPAALAALERALRGAARPLHGAHVLDPGKRSLRFLNSTLGHSLALHVDADPALALADDDVLRRTIGGFENDLRPGDRIRLRDLTVDDNSLIGQDIRLSYQGSVVHPRSVSGTVLRSRGHDRRALLLDAVRPSETTEQSWRVDDVVVADPFTALEEVLTESVTNRVYSRAHGDLNGGNVVVVGSHPCFIDYAHTNGHVPQQADHTWLEVSLLRDQFADFPFGEVVAVQRALAVSSRLLYLGAPADEARDRGRALLGDVRTVAFEVLFTVRKWAHDCYPHEDAGPNWWRDHLCHLLISAHRTLKWSGDVQSPAKLRAVAAVASVATEWLTDSSPFTHWSAGSRNNAITALRPRFVAFHGSGLIRELLTELQPDHDGFIDLVAEHEPAEPVRGTAVALVERVKVAVLTGGPRSGKTRVLREVAYRTAKAANRLPVLLDAKDISSPLVNRDTLAVDAVHLFVDGLDGVPDREAAVAELLRLHEDHPDLPILVCARTADGLRHLPEIRLVEFDEDAVLAHLYRNAPASAVPGLLHTLLDDPLWAPLDLRRPRSLAVLGEHLRRGELPTSPAEAQERMLREELGDVGFDRAAGFAADLLDGVAVGVDDTVTNTAVFVCDGNVLRFAEPSDQDFLAAHALRGQPVAIPVARAAIPEWEGALRVLLTLSDTPSATVRAVVSVLVEEHPARAGRLLRTARAQPPDLVSSFVATQQDVLRHKNDTDGLEAFGCPRAVAEVILEQDVDPAARLAGLALLERMVDHSRPGVEHRTVRTVLAEVSRTVLSGSAPTRLLEHALGAVERSRLRGLELHLAEHLAPPHPWPVVRSAAGALEVLGVALTERARQDYHRAARVRLTGVVEELLSTSDLAEARSLGNERYALVAVLAEHPSSLEVLLRHRFAFDLTAVAPLLDRHLPVTAADPAVLLTKVGDGCSDEVIIAAHELMRERPDLAPQLLDRIGADPDLDRLLIAGAVNPIPLDRAEEIFLGLVHRIEADRIEGLSALLVSIFRADRGRGVRLAWGAARSLAARDRPERLRWPWKAALARCRGSIADLDDLLRSGEVDLAVEALGSWDVLGTGAEGPGRLSAEGEEALWRARPQVGAAAAEVDSWVRAVVAVGLERAVPHLRLLASTVGEASNVVGTSSGVVEVPLAALVLDAIAHLVPSTQDVQAMP